jgi:hypothetical protein
MHIWFTQVESKSGYFKNMELDTRLRGYDDCEFFNNK